ncbi:UDP-N-acetylmuramate:L-alanyl-gamma-D-glutamyl-meso-diaminopimelate ligase [Oceanisphaera profunda]|uniref:UDP-N-acetylmuramate--L-alanyl-gamma-D-glutamyl-meso-2,6-diaminoheptandioate ligase n=1 Tax=Oceanisphaera profunda TaxID=1416627 RepID=A0A1Y0D4H7_9GAMM|nr:UDP-N-acetylmuramate:L-alanyl-gamma-D-glutamyl-meso-diaminopimelate ligase [Oceanisphaera profunda]ART82214.1 UDP-N-acetylmuramate:L-alanyl-gamma-D-glutamyl-meso-diaminopimelate ligase [Oceanisphaera profunda]
MHIHILGICGTFMGGLAVLAKQLGYRVTGSDANVYPPMSTQLTAQGIELIEGYDPAQLDDTPDLVVIGNAMSRGNPCVEAVLNRRLPYTSGPQWLLEHVLQDRWVLAVSGTHGKTTTAAMLAWILEDCGLNPGFLIGGVPGNFEVSARLGEAPFFVIEADEYDSAFFDKRSKFVHYRPSTLIVNNLEFDHADIFDDLAAIQRQFHHLLRMVPSHGRVLVPTQTPAIDEVLAMGCWSDVEYLGEGGLWQVEPLREDGSQFAVLVDGQKVGEVQWDCMGLHNVHNGLMALAAARHAGVPVHEAIKSLCLFVSPKRRMELKGVVSNIRVWDDFAHHPTAIATTLAGLKAQVKAQGNGRVLAVLEPRSNTMKMGIHQQPLADSLQQADASYFFKPSGLDWNLDAVANACPKGQIYEDLEALITALVSEAQPNDHLLVMSNGGFGGIHQRLLDALQLNVDKKS